MSPIRGAPSSFLSSTMSPVLIVGAMLADITVASGGHVRRKPRPPTAISDDRGQRQPSPRG